MRYGIAMALLLAAQTPSATRAFLQSTSTTSVSSCTFSIISEQAQKLQPPKRWSFRHGVSAYAPAGEESPAPNATETSLYLANLVTDAVQSNDDAEEIELAERRRKISERAGT